MGPYSRLPQHSCNLSESGFCHLPKFRRGHGGVLSTEEGQQLFSLFRLGDDAVTGINIVQIFRLALY